MVVVVVAVAELAECFAVEMVVVNAIDLSAVLNLFIVMCSPEK